MTPRLLFFRAVVLLGALSAAAVPAAAQLQISNGSFYISGGGAVAVIGGDVSSNIDITGSGKLILTGMGAAQNLSMNGKNVPVLEVNNANNVQLTSDVRVTGNLIWTAGNVLLGNNGLVYGPSATNTGAGSTAFAVTNGTGFVKKDSLAASSTFLFPIGRATADYTPATVTNGTTVQAVSLAVKNYAESAAAETQPGVGSGRSWQLFTSAGAALSGLALTHNTATNGTYYIPSTAAIVRQQTTGVWSSPASASYGGIVAPAGEGNGTPVTMSSAGNAYYSHAAVLGSTATASTAASSWYAQSSGVLGGLQLSLSAFLQGGMNTANTAMRNDLQLNALLPANSTVGFPSVPRVDYADINNTAGTAGTVCDWVEVQLRPAANPATVAERRMVLLNTAGVAVNPDGTSVLRFASAPGNYHITVDHRNHFPVTTAGALALSESSASAVDFRSPLTGTYIGSGANDPQSVVGSYTAMWGGDVNADDLVYYNSTGNDRSALLATYLLGDTQGFNSAYENGDVNLDAATYYNSTGNDRSWILSKPLAGDSQGFIEAQQP